MLILTDSTKSTLKKCQNFAPVLLILSKSVIFPYKCHCLLCIIQKLNFAICKVSVTNRFIEIKSELIGTFRRNSKKKCSHDSLMKSHTQLFSRIIYTQNWLTKAESYSFVTFNLIFFANLKQELKNPALNVVTNFIYT